MPYTGTLVAPPVTARTNSTKPSLAIAPTTTTMQESSAPCLSGATVTVAHPWAPTSPGTDDHTLLQKAADFLENETGTLDQLSLQGLAATMAQVHIHRETGKVLQPGQESKSAGKAYGIRGINEYLQETLKERYDSKYVAYQEFGDIIFWTNQDRTYRAENYAFNFLPSNPVVVTGAPDTSRHLVTNVSCANHQKNSSGFDSISSIDYSGASAYQLAAREDWRFNGAKWEHYSNGAASGETLSQDEFDHNYQYDPAVGLYISNKTFKVLQSPWGSDTPINLQDGSRVMVAPGQWLVNDGTGTTEVLSDTDKQLKFELAN